MVVAGHSSVSSFDYQSLSRTLIKAKHARMFKVKVTATTVARKTTAERTLTQFAPVGGGRNLFVHNIDTQTLVRGVVERKLGRVVNGQLLPNIIPTNKVSTTCARAIRRVVKYAGHANLMSRQQVVDCYIGSRKLLYQRALASLAERDLCKADFCQKVFIKYEILDGTSKDISAYKPRIICPRSYEASLETGRIVKPTEHRIYKAVDKLYGGRTVVKGLNAEERASVILECIDAVHDPIVVPCDASHADSSVDDHCRKIMHSIYRKMLGREPLIDRVEAWRTGRQTMFGETPTHKIMATGYFGLGSGDQDTSLIMNLLMGILHWTLMDELGIRGRAVIDGDDTLLVIPRGDLGALSGRIESFFYEHGFSMVSEPPVDPAVDLAKVQHCKSYLHHDGVRHTMVRDLTQVLSKDLCTIHNLQSKADFDFYRDAKSRCGLALAGNLPVYGAFYRYLGRGARASKRKDDGYNYRMRTWSRNMSYVRGEITVASRISMFETYGITPDEQMAMESYFDGLSEMTWSKPAPSDSVLYSECIEQLTTGRTL